MKRYLIIETKDKLERLNKFVNLLKKNTSVSYQGLRECKEEQKNLRLELENLKKEMVEVKEDIGNVKKRCS